MTIAYKSLGQLAPAASTLSTLYTVPGGAQAVCSSLTICNRGSAAARVRVAHAVAGAADDAKQYLLYDARVGVGESYVLTIGLALAATDVIRVYADNGQCAFNLHGQEVT